MTTQKELLAFQQKLGAIGGKTAAERMTPKQRKQRAQAAARARWTKKKVKP